MPTKIRIVINGEPVSGVKVLVGTGTVTTNEDGKVSFELEADWQGFVNVHTEIDLSTQEEIS